MITLGLLVIVGIVGYALIVWGQHNIATKSKLVGDSLSEEDQKRMVNLRNLRRKWIFVFSCMIGGLFLVILASKLPR